MGLDDKILPRQGIQPRIDEKVYLWGRMILVGQ
jgi:hypothetical protein